MLLCGLPASHSFQSYHCRSHHVLADEPMATRSSTTTSALRLQQRRHGLVCPNCWTKHPSKQESLPFIAAFCAWIASQDIDNRSRGAAIDPESFRDSAYAPRHPLCHKSSRSAYYFHTGISSLWVLKFGFFDARRVPLRTPDPPIPISL